MSTTAVGVRGGAGVSTSRLPDWARFVIDLLATDQGSVGYGIAAHVKTLTDEDQVVDYLQSLVREFPKDSRAHEVAWELLWLMDATDLVVQT